MSEHALDSGAVRAAAQRTTAAVDLAEETSSVAPRFLRIIGRPLQHFRASWPRTLKRYRPPKIAVILALIAFLLLSAGITLNYFRGGVVRYSEVAFALTLLAFVVWFAGRD